MNKQGRFNQDVISESVAHPNYDGRGITLQNQGTHRMFVGNLLIIPGSSWQAEEESDYDFIQMPEIRFEKNEWREFVNLTENQLPVNILKKGMMAAIQYIQKSNG